LAKLVCKSNNCFKLNTLTTMQNRTHDQNLVVFLGLRKYNVIEGP
jgi:hypothetical protein